MALEIGTEAPDFTLSDSNGDEVTLSQLRGQPVYLNFYPLAFSPVCTDWFTAIAADGSPYEGAVVIGISVDPVVADAGWYPRINGQNITQSPITSTYYRFTFPDFQEVSKDGIALEVGYRQSTKTPAARTIAASLRVFLFD